MLKSRHGFTLVEIVIVLAISSMLLIIVFLAVSGALKSRRDTQRKRDLAKIATLIETYASNNKGVYPTAAQATNPASQFRTQYGTLQLTDPTAGQTYIIASDFSPCSTASPYDNHGPGYISYTTPGVGSYSYRLRICLESGGDYNIGS